MQDEQLNHEIELYMSEAFHTLLEHEVNRSRRYKNPITLLHLALEIQPDTPQARYGAELFAINLLNSHLRDTDIPSKSGSEFLVLMPATDEQGARIVSDRLETLFHSEHSDFDKVSFRLSAFIGMATLSGDRSITSKSLLNNASLALQHARSNRSLKAVLFSEIK